MKLHVMSLVFVFVLGLFAGELWADNRFHLSVETMLAGSSGNEAVVLCDSDLQALSFSYGVRFDPAVLRVESVSNAATAASGADYYEGLIDNDNGLIGYGCVFDIDGDFSTQVLAPGNDHIIGVISFEVLAAAGETALSFETVAIGPNLNLPIRNVLTNDVGNSIHPGLEGAIVEISVPLPEIVVDPGSHDFGEVMIGDTLMREFVVRNEGSAALEVIEISLSAGASAEFTIVGNPAPVTIAPKAQESFTVSYSPVDEGLDSATVVISSDDEDASEVAVPLRGSGIPVPEICDNGEDDDGDGDTDCADSDCPACPEICDNGEDDDGDGDVDCVDVDCADADNCQEPAGPTFVRGDANSDGAINLTDGVIPLLYLFSGGNAPACGDAADTNDSGALEITDAIIIFGWLFSGGVAPAAPSPQSPGYAAKESAVDPTEDGLGCDAVSPVCQ